MPRIFQVEYMTRPDEREHIEQFDDLRTACRLAREMSDKHDGDAVVCALDPRPDGDGDPRDRPHRIRFRHGQRASRHARRHRCPSLSSKPPMTYEEYEAAVVAEIIRQTGWTEKEARNMAADLQDFIEDDMSPSDAAQELLRDTAS